MSEAEDDNSLSSDVIMSMMEAHKLIVANMQAMHEQVVHEVNNNLHVFFANDEAWAQIQKMLDDNA